MFANPFKAAQAADAVVQQTARHVSDSTPDEQACHRHSCGEKSRHNDFAIEGEDAAGEESREEHAGGSDTDEKLYKTVHFQENSSKKVHLGSISKGGPSLVCARRDSNPYVVRH